MLAFKAFRLVGKFSTANKSGPNQRLYRTNPELKLKNYSYTVSDPYAC